MSPFSNIQHDIWRTQVRTFVEREIKPIAAQLDRDETFSVELVQKMGREGLFGIDIPISYGGRGFDAISYIIAVEEIARVDGSQAVTMAAHNSLGITPIYLYGNEAQKQRLLPPLCAGEAMWAFGLTEINAGSDAKGVETVANHVGDSWVINGSKRYITNGSNSLLKGMTVLAITGHEEHEKKFSTILVERDAPGFNTERMLGKMMWRASDTAQVELVNVNVPYDNILGEKSKGLRNMLKALDSGRLSIAAMGLGLAQGAFEMALAYANERQQFGNELSRFQVIAFKLSDMALKLELARNTLYKACWLKDNDQPYGKEAAMAKLYCGQIAKEIADEAVQIFGGAGLFKSNDIERFYRDQRILQIGEGTTEILQLVIARYLGIEN